MTSIATNEVAMEVIPSIKLGDGVVGNHEHWSTLHIGRVSSWPRNHELKLKICVDFGMQTIRYLYFWELILISRKMV